MTYPILAHKPNDSFLYAFSRERDFNSTSRELLRAHVFKNTFLIDLMGSQFEILSAREIGWSNAFWGYSLIKKGRQIVVEFRLKSDGRISLEEFKSFVNQRIEGNPHYHFDEIKNQIERASDCKSIIDLFC